MIIIYINIYKYVYNNRLFVRLETVIIMNQEEIYRRHKE